MAKPKPTPKQPSKRGVLVRVAVSLALLAAAIYVLATHWKTVNDSLQLARGASIGWLVVSVAVTAFGYCIAAASYGVLALHPLRYWQTVLVELSTAFVNRLLPSGIGSLGLNGLYLYRRKHTVAEATVVVSLNNLLGIAVHLSLLAGVVVLYPSALHQLFAGRHWAANWRIALAALAVVAMVLMLPAVRQRVASFVGSVLASVHKFCARQIVLAVVVAALNTTFSTIILWVVARSLQVHLGMLQTFIIFSLGMLASTATPTPGGLVGAEAGLFAGFVAYGVASPTAGAAVLLYRLITYWLPLIPGALALLAARRAKLV